MITGIGTDLVEIARVQKAIGRSSFLKKVYTEQEQELIKKRSVRAAGNFAAKEAVAKAFGCGFSGISPIEIEVLRKESGLPYVVLHGRAKKKAEELGIDNIFISITDTEEYAQCYAVCENKKKEDKSGFTTCFGGFPVLDGKQMKEADRKTIEEKQIPSLVLMERAALAVKECVMSYVGPGCEVGVLCGTGNNGADGVAVARMLREEGVSATVLVMDPGECRNVAKGTPEFVKQIQMAEAFDVPVCGMEETGKYRIIVDALFGIGLSKPVTGAYANVLERLNREEHIIIAVDIPSGISADTGKVCGVALYADETVTFGAPKVGQLLYPGKEYTGKLRVANIGFPKDVLEQHKSGFCLNEKQIGKLLPRRSADSNKGTFGKVVVIAGSRDMAGAAYFSACAAYRMGVGLVKIATPECNREILQQLLPEAMLAVYGEEDDLTAFAESLIAFADGIVIGPGLGQSDAAKRLLVAVCRMLKKQKENVPASVWDADALNIISGFMTEQESVLPEERRQYLEEFLPIGAVITPHPGELSRLTGKTVSELKEDFLSEAKRLSCEGKAVYVLKDAVTLVAQEGKVFINTMGNNGMATGGSGDMLSGIIAGLLVQGVPAFEAASAGVWLHGAAGDRAASELGQASVLVRDMLQALGNLCKETY